VLLDESSGSEPCSMLQTLASRHIWCPIPLISLKKSEHVLEIPRCRIRGSVSYNAHLSDYDRNLVPSLKTSSFNEVFLDLRQSSLLSRILDIKGVAENSLVQKVMGIVHVYTEENVWNAPNVLDPH